MFLFTATDLHLRTDDAVREFCYVILQFTIICADRGGNTELLFRLLFSYRPSIQLLHSVARLTL